MWTVDTAIRAIKSAELSDQRSRLTGFLSQRDQLNVNMLLHFFFNTTCVIMNQEIVNVTRS